MNTTFYYIPGSDSLVHHGIKGQKWGERRYQNSDGTWTAEGKARRRLYSDGSSHRNKDQSRNKISSKRAEKQQQRVDESDAKLYRAVWEMADKAFKKNEKPDPWSDKNVIKAADNYLKNSSKKGVVDGFYPEVYKNKKAADRKMIAAMALGATVGGLSVASLGIGAGTAASSAGIGAGIGASVTGMFLESLPLKSIRKVKHDYLNARNDLITMMYDEVERDY